MKARFEEFLARIRQAPQDLDRERLAAILALSRAMAGAQDWKEVSRLLLDEAIRLFGAERGFLIHAEEDALRIDLARNLDREMVRQPDRKISSTVVRSCLEQRAGVFVRDACEDFASAASVADQQLRSVLCIPLLVGEGECLGCIYLDHRFHKGVFREEDLPWFQAFADQGSIALHLHQLLSKAQERRKLVEVENVQLTGQVAAQAHDLARGERLSRHELRHSFPAIRGQSQALLRHLALLDRLVEGGFPVLLQGDSGTGKELAARALHNESSRSRGPFVPINVAAIPAELMESELFGHRRGAFTGADRSRRGLLQEADGGVLFLDEIGELSMELQAKLLRFLELRAVRPLGGDREERVDVRVVAATHRDLRKQVERGRFREDLYYRLAVVTVPVPALRHRAEDIPDLAQAFLDQAVVARGGASRVLSADVAEALAARSWPGNLRELRNEMVRLDALVESGRALQVADLSPDPGGARPGAVLSLAQLEEQAIEHALSVCDGNKTEAARLLGISRRTLYNKLDRP